jgi:hypothetical protein
MEDEELPKWLPVKRRVDRRTAAADIRSEGGYGLPDAGLEAMSEVAMESPRRAETDTEATQSLQRPQQQLARAPLDQIATLVQTLTYGEMMELSEAIWKGQAQRSDVTQESLPALLYCWSISRFGKG